MEQKEFLKTIQAYRRRLHLAAFIKYSVFALSVAVAAGIYFRALMISSFVHSSVISVPT